MAEKKATAKKATETKAAEVKKATTAKKAATKAAKTENAGEAIAINAQNVGFKAGDVYQALASAGKPLSYKEIAQEAAISEEETLLGLGWLLKEGKLANDGDKITLA